MKTIGCVQHDCDECKQLREQNTALYEAPPAAQRTWVGLTGEEIINMSCGDLHYAALMGDVVRKLKEKNT